MKMLFTIIAVVFFFSTAKATVSPYATPIKINVPNTSVKLSLLAAGKVNISWSAVAVETSTTIYEIQKSTDNGEFKTIAILMGESYPTYSFRDKITVASGNIEYRVVICENNVVIGSVSQNLIVL